MILDKTAFITSHTRLLPVPHASDICLYVADEATELWQKTEDELGEIGLPPPFWAFAWAGGQALARYLLDHREVVAGKRVLDFASGSGLVAIAAAKAGAKSVDAVDIDAFATHAMALNAAANGVEINSLCQNLIGEDHGWDVIVAGDVCYQRDMAEQVLQWLRPLAQQGRMVLLGDPNRSYFPKSGVEKLITYQVPVTRALEDLEIKQTAVFRLL